MEEYESLRAMVNIEKGERREFYMGYEKYKTQHWINAVHSKNKRKLSNIVCVYYQI